MDLDVNGAPKTFYIVMEYCGTINLEDYVERSRQNMPLSEVAEITYNIACGLNVMLTILLSLDIAVTQKILRS